MTYLLELLLYVVEEGYSRKPVRSAHLRMPHSNNSTRIVTCHVQKRSKFASECNEQSMKITVAAIMVVISIWSVECKNPRCKVVSEGIGELVSFSQIDV